MLARRFYGDVLAGATDARAPGHGALHSFPTTIPMTPGNHTVCVYAINTRPPTAWLSGATRSPSGDRVAPGRRPHDVARPDNRGGARSLIMRGTVLASGSGTRPRPITIGIGK